jgi:hypothetical protein
MVHFNFDSGLRNVKEISKTYLLVWLWRHFQRQLDLEGSHLMNELILKQIHNMMALLGGCKMRPSYKK